MTIIIIDDVRGSTIKSKYEVYDLIDCTDESHTYSPFVSFNTEEYTPCTFTHLTLKDT